MKTSSFTIGLGVVLTVIRGGVAPIALADLGRLSAEKLAKELGDNAAQSAADEDARVVANNAIDMALASSNAAIRQAAAKAIADAEGGGGAKRKRYFQSANITNCVSDLASSSAQLPVMFDSDNTVTISNLPCSCTGYASDVLEELDDQTGLFNYPQIGTDSLVWTGVGQDGYYLFYGGALNSTIVTVARAPPGFPAASTSSSTTAWATWESTTTSSSATTTTTTTTSSSTYSPTTTSSSTTSSSTPYPTTTSSSTSYPTSSSTWITSMTSASWSDWS